MSEYDLFLQYQNELNMKILYSQIGASLVGLIIVVIGVFCIPFFPLLVSKLRGKRPIVFLMTKGRNMRLFSGVRLRNSMYATKHEAEYFVKKHAGHMQFLGVPVDIIHADLGFVQHPQYNNIIRTLRNSGYLRWQTLQNAITTYNPNTVEDSLKEKFTEEEIQTLLTSKNPLHLHKKSKIYEIGYGTCSLDELNAFGAKVSPASIGGQIADDILSQESPVVPGFMDKYGKLIILAVMVIVGGALAFVIISTVK